MTILKEQLSKCKPIQKFSVLATKLKSISQFLNNKCQKFQSDIKFMSGKRRTNKPALTNQCLFDYEAQNEAHFIKSTLYTQILAQICCIRTNSRIFTHYQVKCCLLQIKNVYMKMLLFIIRLCLIRRNAFKQGSQKYFNHTFITKIVWD